MRILSILLIAGLPVAAAAQQPDLGTEQQRQEGRILYMDLCAQCHGAEGRGDGYAAPFLRPAPRDFTPAIYKVRTTPSGQLPTDEDLRRIIRDGMPYTGMPGWPRLNARQIQSLIYFLKTFNDDFAGPFGIPDVIDVPRPPSFSEESARRGREVYFENQCHDCHGELGRGDGPSAPTLTDQWDHHIRPADLTKRWTFVGGSTRQDIYRTFSTGLDGTPMPAFEVNPIEDRWALVDFVYSLSRDRPEYSTVVTARGVESPLDVSLGKELFAEAGAAYFPLFGQIMEPGRAFMPGVNGVEVRALYNADEIAIMLAWNDMTADTDGSNSPTIEVPRIFEVVRDTAASPFSDAVAIQLPALPTPGVERPYFVFGDARRPVDLWFADLARGEPEAYLGRGTGNLEPLDETIDFFSDFQDGEWVAVFKRARVKEGGASFQEGGFVPIAFSIWDGFNHERGNRRGLTGWYHVYVEPTDRPSALGPMLQWGLLTLVLQIGIIFYVRRRHRRAVSV